MASGFLARGGAWVLAQAVLLGLALVGPALWSWSYFWPLGLHMALGGVLLAIGLALAMGGVLALGTSLTPLPHPKDDSQLKTDGVYRLVRHPIYSGLIFLVAGYALIFPSLPEGLLALGNLLFFDRKATREEAWLRLRYPDYPAYVTRSHKLIPWVY